MKILIVLGTRPEVIKLALLIRAIKQDSRHELKVCSTGQHQEMIAPLFDFFDIQSDFNLDIMQENQKLTDIVCKVLTGLTKIFQQFRPDRLIVQGDTGTACASALTAFYEKIPVMHVEAGLRSYNRYSPWPEELNRRIIGNIADIHCAATPKAAEQLKREGVQDKEIFITGNTVIDALLETRDNLLKNKELLAQYNEKFSYLDENKKLILVTGHRRESFGKPLENICDALKQLALRDDIVIVYPVHFNPNVRNAVNKTIKSEKNIFLIEPVDYPEFVFLMNRSYLILTDSGGIQEEAPALSKPVLVLRDTTERPEGLHAGMAKLVGTNQNEIVKETEALLDDQSRYHSMQFDYSPYGDGHAVMRILDILGIKT